MENVHDKDGDKFVLNYLNRKTVDSMFLKVSEKVKGEVMSCLSYIDKVNKPLTRCY